MAFKSIQTHVSDGTLESVQFSISFLSTEHLHFYVDDVEITTGTASQGVMVDGVDEYGVTLTAAVPSGAVFKVQRQTPRDNVPHVFSTGSALFTALTVDANNEYLLYVVQETYEQSGQGPFPEITELVGTEYVTIETGGVRKQITVQNFLASVASTTTLILDLANTTDPAKGVWMLGYKGETQGDANERYDAATSQHSVNLQELNLRASFIGGFYDIFDGTYPTTSSSYISEPTLIETANKKVIAFFRVGDGHTVSDGSTGYLCARKFDPETNTWGGLQTISATAGYDSRNQTACVTQTGRIILAYYKCQMSGGEVVEATRSTVYRYSDDNGDTWSGELSLSQYCPYPTLDNVPFGKAVIFNSGKITITLYNWHTFFTLSSTDNGMTWGSPVTIYTTPLSTADNYTEPCLVKIDDTRVACIARVMTSGLTRVGSAVLEYVGRNWGAYTYYQKGAVVCNSGSIYEATTSGTSGAESGSPSHISGSATEGSVTWQYLAPRIDWTDGATYTAGQYVRTYYSYSYRVVTGGTVGTSAPSDTTLAGGEWLFVVYRSSDGGATWDSGSLCQWSADTFKVTTSPPSIVVDGDTLHLLWFARNPEFKLYKVSAPTRQFFNSPELAIRSGLNSRNTLALSALLGSGDPAGLQIDCGYVSAIKLSFCDKLMLAWYDNPTLAVGDTSLYGMTIRP